MFLNLFAILAGCRG